MNKTVTPNNTSLSEQEAVELLPWYINGTLTHTEMQKVEEALEVFPNLQKEASLLKQTMNHTNAKSVTLSESEIDTQFSKVMDQLQQSKSAKAKVITGSGKSWLEYVQSWFSKPWVPMSATAAVLAIIALQWNPGASPIVNPLGSTDPTFVTHSSNQSERTEDVTIQVLTVSPTTKDQLLSILPNSLNTVSVQEVSKQEFELLIPASIDSQTLNKLLLSLTSNNEIQDVTLKSKE